MTQANCHNTTDSVGHVSGNSFSHSTWWPYKRLPGSSRSSQIATMSASPRLATWMYSWLMRLLLSNGDVSWYFRTVRTHPACNDLEIVNVKKPCNGWFETAALVAWRYQINFSHSLKCNMERSTMQFPSECEYCFLSHECLRKACFASACTCFFPVSKT